MDDSTYLIIVLVLLGALIVFLQFGVRFIMHKGADAAMNAYKRGKIASNPPEQENLADRYK